MPSAKCSSTPSAFSVKPVTLWLSRTTFGIGLSGAGSEEVVQVGAVELGVGRAVHPLMFFGEREALDHFAGVVQAEDIGARAARPTG